MHNHSCRRYRRPAVLLFLSFFAAAAHAGPWADPGDLALRHDLQLLADHGLLDAPLTTWPLAWADIDQGLRRGLNPISKPEVAAALSRVRQRLSRAARNGRLIPRVEAAAAHNPVQFRTFTNTPRESLEGGLGVEYTGDWFAYRLQAQAVSDPEDKREIRADGSYVGAKLGNWSLRADTLERWWGPGWDGSLILSNNARPIPAVTLQREQSTPFSWRPLRWLGPWQFNFMLGQLEGNRDVPHAKFLGMRVNFKPTPKLEIGLSRTAQWGGDGRPQGLGTLADVLLGRDNTGQAGITATNEPGNQLAGYDIRWTSPLFDLPYALYAQLIGEDEAGGLPNRFIFLGGAEVWGGLGDDGQSYRLHLEYADTTAGVFGSYLPNYAYEHHIYRDGYRYYGRPIGHSIDRDTRSLSLSGVLVRPSGASWEALARGIRTDRYSPASRDILSLELRHGFTWAANRFLLGAGVLRDKTRDGGQTNTEGQAFLRWSREFR